MRGVNMRYKSGILSLFIVSIILCATLVFCACGAPAVNKDDGESQKIVYTNVYPDNEFTSVIPKPTHGNVQYTIEFLVEKNKFAICFENITRTEADEYVEILKRNGYRLAMSSVEAASAGYLLSKGTTNISLSCAEGIMTMLITLDSNTK